MGHRSMSMPVTRSIRPRTDSGSGSGGRGEQGAALGEGGRAAAIGEQTDVTNADEAVGHDVQQEAAEELVDREVHDLDAIAIGVVAPPEADRPSASESRRSLEMATRWV